MKYFFFLLLICLSISGISQSGGNNAFDYLNLTNSARVASLGGQQISLYDDDLNLVFHNPSLLSEGMSNNLVLNYMNYFAGINYGYAAYAWKPKKPYMLGAGIHYVNYGEFEEYDEANNRMGTFRAADYAFNLYYARPVKDSMLYFGFNVKPLYSDLETYMSFSMAFDAGLTYISQDRLFTAALVIKNSGLQIIKYYPDQPREPLPFEIQVGLTKKLSHAPFRFSIVGQQLQKPDLRYTSEIDLEEQIDPLTGELREEDKLAIFADNFMRHLIFGVEFIPSNNFNVRLGYNYKRRQEMKLKDAPATVGFSWGFGIKISKFHISYARSSYFIHNGSNFFSVAMNLSEFKTKL